MYTVVSGDIVVSVCSGQCVHSLYTVVSVYRVVSVYTVCIQWSVCIEWSVCIQWSVSYVTVQAICKF